MSFDGQFRWSDELVDTLIELREAGYTWREAGEHIGVSRDAARNAVRRHKRKQKIEEEQRRSATVEFLDLKADPEKDWGSDYISLAARTQDLEKRLDMTQPTVNVRINDTRPIGIVFTGDWHIGSRGTDYRLMESDFKTWRDTDGLYVGCMGDYIDNYIIGRVPPGQNEQQFNPEMQQRLLANIVPKYFSEKALWWVLGNHDNWTDRSVGLHPIMDMARRLKQPYLEHWGKVFLNLNGIEYEIAVAHDYPGRSAINTMNNQRRFYEHMGGPDVVALAHLHYSDVQMTSKGGKDSVWIRSGTYKVNDPYAKQWVKATGDPRMPMLIFFPDEKAIEVHRDFRRGLRTLEFLRTQEYGEKED